MSKSYIGSGKIKEIVEWVENYNNLSKDKGIHRQEGREEVSEKLKKLDAETKNVEIGDKIETPYGVMKIVDIEINHYSENQAYIETRLIDDE